MTDLITKRAAREISNRMGCIVSEIEHDIESNGFKVVCQFDTDSFDRNYLTLIHAIQFKNRQVAGFVSYDDLDCLTGHEPIKSEIGQECKNCKLRL
jgi:hypothetical protein